MESPIIYFFLLFAFPLIGQQRQAAVWRYGVYNQMDFNFSPVKITLGPEGSSTQDGAAAICDSNGVLQFYTGGGWIKNRDDSMIVDFNSVYPSNSSGAYGGNIIIPFQYDPYRFYYFNIRNHNPVGPNGRWFEIFQFVVDMRKGNGMGRIDSSQTKIIQDSVGTQLACALHANGRDTWLICRQWRSDSLVALLVQDTGIAKTVYSKLGSPTRIPNIHKFANQENGYDSQIKTSPNSEMILIPRRTIEYPFHELYRFNRETGEVHSRVCIKDTTKSSPFYLNGYPDGAFSPDSKLLYTGTGTRTKQNFTNEGPGTVWQYSVENYDSISIAESKLYLGTLGRKVPTIPGELYPFSPRFQLALDGRIYVSPGSYLDSLLSVIKCPDKRGADCQLKFRDINLQKGRNGAYFPTLNQTFVRNAGIFQLQGSKRSFCHGVTDTLELSAYGAGAEHFQWSVSPALPQSVKLDTLTWQRFSIQNLPVGSYTFSCKGTSRCGDVYEKSMVVNIRPNPAMPVISSSVPPSASLGRNVLCQGDSVRLFVADTLAKYHWSFGDGPASQSYLNTGLAYTQKVSLVTENQYGCQSPPSDTVVVESKPIPQAPKPVIQSVPAVYADSGFVALCAEDSVRLTATGSQEFVWSDGSTLPVRTFSGAGSISLIGYNTEGCAAKAETEVRYKTLANPIPTILRQAQDDTVLTLATLNNRNYCVSGLPGSTFSFSVTGGEKVDSSQDCITINWLPATKNRLLTATETRKEAPCSGTATQAFTYRPNLDVPTLITPNNDGHNDAFVIQDLEFYASHQLQIFDRWGKKVVDTSSYKQDWKGETGIYFYNLVVDGMEFTGWISSLVNSE